jgi:hypothetical protein
MNYELTTYGDCWRMRALNFFARRLRILVHVDGYPFGWPRENKLGPAKAVATELRRSVPLLLHKRPIGHVVVAPRIQGVDHQ